MWGFYIDGAARGQGTDLNKGHVIPGHGHLVLGQSQGIMGGGFNASLTYIGQLSEFNWFSRRRLLNQIKLVSVVCKGAIWGDVIRWQDFRMGVRGDVGAISPSTCLAVGKSSGIDLSNR